MDTRTVFGKLSPPITKMIRMDHSHVMVTSHKFTSDASPDKKKAIVESVCLALTIHAQLEEEIFYPALREVDGGNEVLAKAKPEHDEMRRLIEELHGMAPTDPRYDAGFRQLMRNVTHHVADEESELLPAAERLLKDRLGELGAQMTRRRLQLAAPHVGEMAVNHARAMPASTMLVAGGLLAGAYLLGRRGLEHRRHH
jgi:hemerythrin superfamily protein